MTQTKATHTMPNGEGGIWDVRILQELGERVEVVIVMPGTTDNGWMCRPWRDRLSPLIPGWTEIPAGLESVS